ncbi:hypothetical protein [Paenibacillus sp. GCM10027626]|uniref:hypothetical protein n=1 Tax=Paenibacillus sp. GCM10027626 TaxID=3273411 RepID=UPI00363B3447
MSIFTIAKHPIDPKRILVAFSKDNTVEWIIPPVNIRVDQVYADDYTELLDVNAKTENLEEFFWRNRNISFSSIKVHTINARSKYAVIQGNKWEVLINNRYIGILPNSPNIRESERLKNIARDGGLIITDNTSPTDPWIIRTFFKPNVNGGSDLFTINQNIKTKYESSKSKSNTDLTTASIKTTNEFPRNKTKVGTQTSSDSLEKALVNLFEKPVEPLKETLDRIERKVNDILSIRDTLQKMEMRIRNVSNSIIPPTQLNTNVINTENYDKLLKELEESRYKINSLEISVNDTQNRLLKSEIRINDQLKSKFTQVILQLQGYLNGERLIFSEETLYKQMSPFLEKLNDSDKEGFLTIINPIIDQYMHQIYTLKLLIQVLDELGWQNKR